MSVPFASTDIPIAYVPVLDENIQKSSLKVYSEFSLAEPLTVGNKLNKIAANIYLTGIWLEYITTLTISIVWSWAKR
ncbi:MAG: hypothetical protein F6K24_03265 [Okeania sp. SIO2D1]|nr:hypothetical protein [Okeania sp. SIO2D1]